jgi:predicted MFS family arabinose efflux permease
MPRDRQTAGFDDRRHRLVAVLNRPARGEIPAAVRATYAAFIATGVAFASWASRIPQVKDRLGLDPSGLGLVLLAIAAGSVIALPLSGPVVTRFGSRRTVAAMSVLAGAGLVVVALGYRIGVAPVVAGLFAFGVGTGSWDVAMNVQGALVERRLGRAIMPRFHAGFSIGTVAGALGGAAMVALGIGVTVHLAIVGVAVAVLVPLAVRGFIADRTGPPEDGAREGAGRASLRAWRESRTLLVGVFVLAFAFAEGAGNDWIGVALIDDHGVAPAIGTLGFALFLAAMTAGRWFGPWALDAYGRVPVIRTLTVVAVVGLILFSFGPGTPVAFAGAILWGAGISLGFPVGMSAGADEPARAASRVSVISSIGYCAFLGGPPLIGFLAQQSSVLRALTAVIALLALAGLLAGNVRPLTPPPE